MSAWTIYWIIKLDAIHSIVSFFSGISWAFFLALLVTWVVTWIIHVSCTSSESYCPDPTPEDISKTQGLCQRIRKGIKWPIIISMIFLFPFQFMVTFLPSTKEMAVIYVTPKVLNNATIKKIPGKLLKEANEWIENLTPKAIVDEAKKVIKEIKKE